MKTSIRKKMLIYMLTIVLFFSVVIIFSNVFLVEKYYLSQKKKDLLNSSNEIVKLINGKSEEMLVDEDKYIQLNVDDEFMLEVARIEKLTGQSVMLMDYKNNLFYPAYNMVTSNINSKPFEARKIVEPSVTVDPEITVSVLDDTIFPLDDTRYSLVMDKDENGNAVFSIVKIDGDDIAFFERGEENSEPAQLIENGMMIENGITTNPIDKPLSIKAGDSNKMQVQEQDENSYFLYTKNENFDIDDLSYMNNLENGVSMVLSTPLATITENTKVLNKFITIISLVALGFTIIWAFFISDKFTKPITEIQKTTEQMTNLDFTQKLNIDTNDELGKLANHINYLSSSLNQTINQLNEKNIKLEKDIDKERKIDKMRRDFISNVSHELKTPIFLIQGYADGLKANIGNEEKRNQYCNVINDEANKMDALVKNLLTLARLETENINNLEQKKVEINGYLETIVNKYNLNKSNHELKITFNKVNDLYVTIDEFKIEQVITNIVNNAYAHVNKVDEDEIINIRLDKTDDDFVKVSIFNTGDNINENDLERLWDDFYKSDQARTRQSGRVGLGLSIVKSILNAHDSDFGAENKSNGVEFWFKLKISNEK